MDHLEEARQNLAAAAAFNAVSPIPLSMLEIVNMGCSHEMHVHVIANGIDRLFMVRMRNRSEGEIKVAANNLARRVAKHA